MTVHVWCIQGTHLPETSGSYMPVPDPAIDAKANRDRRSRANYRAKTGAPVAPEELPEAYEHDRPRRQTKLDVAIWNSAFEHIREDVAEVMRTFDLGATVLRPIKIAPVGNKGVDSRYLILLTSNIRATIDPENSEPMRPGSVKSAGLSCTGPVHQKVQALRPAQEGPAIWTDPTVNSTIFVNEDLAMALKAAPFARDLDLKKIRVSEA